MGDRQSVIKILYNLYNYKGYVTENEIFDACDANDLTLSDIDFISNQLIDKGVLIADEPKSKNITTDEIVDKSKADYEVIYRFFNSEYPGMKPLIRYIRNVVPPQNREMDALMTQYRGGNKCARKIMIEKQYRAALRIVYTYKNKTNIPLDDLFSVAVLGTMRAIEQYDPYEHDSIISYFGMWMMHTINRYIGDYESLIRIPIHVHDILMQIKKIKDNEVYENNKELLFIISEELDIPYDKAEELLMLSTRCNTESYEHIVRNNRESHIRYEPDEYISEDDFYEMLTYPELVATVRAMLNTFTDREQQVIALRYGIETGEEKTLEEVGEILGVTRERIRQIEAKALKKLKNPHSREKLMDFITYQD